MRKKVFIIFLVAFLLNIPKVNSLGLGENTEGQSEQGDFVPCSGDNPEAWLGCAWNSENFKIRVTLIDKNLKIVQGTKTVEFEPINPYNDRMNYIAIDVDKSDSEAGTLNWNRERYNFLGTMIANDANGQSAFRNLDTVADKKYAVYLGFGKDQAVANNFSDYADNRKKFIDFTTSLKKGIYVQDINKNVDFISFFLKVSGYTDTLNNNKGTWTASEIYDITKKIGYDNEYYLLVEPVYSYGTWIRGTDGVVKQYYAEGTAQQLSSFYLQGRPAIKQSFWIAKSPDIIYNHACNFMDFSEKYAELVKGWEVRGYTSNEFVKEYRNYCNSIDTVNNLSEFERNEMSYFAALPGSGFGKNLIDISEIFKENTPPKSSCKLKVDSCTIDTEGSNIQANDNFKLQTKLLVDEGKISDCVYPGTMATEEELGQYIHHVGEGQNQLWCYDDITYDFSPVQNALKGKTFSQNQLIEIPNGELKVERTCYTASKNIKETAYLDQVFKNDPGKYQNKFIFEIGNKKLEFVKNSYKSQEPIEETKECEDEESKSGCKYKYTSIISYQYELKNSTDTSDLNIGITDLELYNSVSTTNSIDFINKYKTSKLTKISNDVEEGTNISKLSTQITDGYGLTNDIYKKLKSDTVTRTSEIIQLEGTDETITYYRTNNNQVSNRLELNLEENKKDYCDVSSTISKDLSKNVQFRVISLTNPFPARDGATRLPGENWLNRAENNVYYYIQNNRNVNTEEVYNKEPLYKITLNAQTMLKIREYNKTHSYSGNDVTCETGTGRMCLSNFLRETTYIPRLLGTCKKINPKEITSFNREILDFEKSACNKDTQCMIRRQEEVKRLDINKDGYVTSDDLLTADFYTCADKSPKSGG